MVSIQEYLSNLTLCSRTSKYMCSLLLNFTPNNFFLNLNKLVFLCKFFIYCLILKLNRQTK